jgi:putative endopeptidase
MSAPRAMGLAASVTLLLALQSGASDKPASAAAHARAEIAPWGLDLSSRDLSVKPGDDFYRYADGHWLDTHSIPADRTRWGSFDELQERSEQQVRTIVEGLPKDAPAGSVAQ